MCTLLIKIKQCCNLPNSMPSYQQIRTMLDGCEDDSLKLMYIPGWFVFSWKIAR